MVGEVTIQAEITGSPRNRHYQLQEGEDVVDFGFPRTSRVIMGVDDFGNAVYIPLPGFRFDASILPHLLRGSEKLLGPEAPGRSFNSAIHKKTTMSGWTEDKEEFIPEKTSGFVSLYERKQIAKIRRDRELKRLLLRAGIDEHKLFLLIHSTAHSQTQFEKELALKSLPDFKRGGFGSIEELKEMKKQRRRNQRLMAGRR